MRVADNEYCGMKIVVDDTIPDGQIDFCRPLEGPISENAKDRIAIKQVGGRLLGYEIIGRITNIR